MLIGSGMLAQAFASGFAQREDVCIYAAGVSNSSCTEAKEFARDRSRLAGALQQAANLDAFVYFGTCSVGDPELRNTPYVQHKLAMEALVSALPCYMIIRLPQVAGNTPNPHTLLNFLHARIARSEAFSLWKNAKRNIIDVSDVAAITGQLIADKSARKITLNVANPVNYPMIEIVRAMERAVGKPAVYDVVDRGSEYRIDVSEIVPILDKANVTFGSDYLERVVGKYYGKNS